MRRRTEYLNAKDWDGRRCRVASAAPKGLSNQLSSPGELYYPREVEYLFKRMEENDKKTFEILWFHPESCASNECICALSKLRTQLRDEKREREKAIESKKALEKSNV